MTAPYKRILALDFETAWGRAAKLGFSCQTNEEYIRDPRFKAWGLAFKWVGEEGACVWINKNHIKGWLQGVNWEETAVVCHNAQFDATILSWIYGVQPAFLFDTLSMGRALRGVEVGNSLKKLAEDYELPPKGDGLSPSENILDALPFAVEETLAEYCKHDTWLCEQLFLKMLPGYPAKELRLIDMTVRMYTQAQLRLDAAMLEKAIEEEKEKRETLLTQLNVKEEDLASNPKFAVLLESLGVDAPKKISKTTGQETLALAKNDALFQSLLNGDNDVIATLCEARVCVKSTSERTRAQRFLDISTRGPLPVPLSYFGASTGRYTASKGSAINMQNLKRGSFLRKAIMAPKGHVLVVCDLSQIEVRVLAWLADYKELLEVFKRGEDPYAAFGAQMFGIPSMTKETHPIERQSAKSALLGCFAADTQVLTNVGWKAIVSVLPSDLLWDGVAWVQHRGLLNQGLKHVLKAFGVSATPSHEIWVGHGWQTWSAVLANPSLFLSALKSASLPVLNGAEKWTDPRAIASQCGSLSCDVLVDGKALSPAPICAGGVLHAAMHAQKRSRMLHVWRAWASRLLSQTLPTESAYLRALVPSLVAAQTKTITCIQTMADAVLPCTQRGAKAALNFFATLFPWRGGINLSCNSIELTTIKATNLETYASAHVAKTCPTSEKSHSEKWKNSSGVLPNSNEKIQVYDIAMAGPRNRYTILTDEGPIIVHNCGYQLGWASFAAQLLTGFLGAPPLRYKKEDAKKLGVNAEQFNLFINWEENINKMQAIPHTCTEEELLIHCLAAQAIINKYRSTATPVVNFWELLKNVISQRLYAGEESTYKGALIFRKGEIVLPSGMAMKYPDLQPSENERGRIEWTYWGGKKREKLYAGKVTNNCVQGTARCVMTDGMLRVDKRYFVAGTVHDELITVVPEKEVDEAKVWIKEQMVQVPKYLPGIPLNAEVGAAVRYGEAKN